MSPSTAHEVKIEQLQSEIAEIFVNAPVGLTGNTRLAVPDKPRNFNAVRHGLSGQHVVIGAEEVLHYAQMCLDYMRDIKPVGALETGAAQLFVEDRWRLHRILKIENDLFCFERSTEEDPESHPRKSGPERQVNAFREEARNIDLISRYQTRLVRNSGRMMDEIRKLRKERAVVDPELTYDEQTSPAVGFYRRLLAHAERLTEARREYEAYQAAQQAEAAESITSSTTSFGNSPTPDTPPQRENADQQRDLHVAWTQNAA